MIKRRGLNICARSRPNLVKEQGDAGRDDQTRLARPDSKARMGTGKIKLELTTSRVDCQPYSVYPYPAVLSDYHT